MATIKIEVIEMPDVNEVKATAKLCKEQKEQEWSAYCEKQYADCMADLPRFITFINKQIENSKLNGDTCVNFSFCGGGWKTVDERCKFQTKGWVSYDFVEIVEKIYKELGFYASVRHIQCLTNSAYRDGEVYISWAEHLLQKEN